MALGNQASLDANLQPMAQGNQTSLDVDLQIAPDANEPIPSPVEDADLARPRLISNRCVLVFFCHNLFNHCTLQIDPHPNTFFNPALHNLNWDDVIFIPSDDDEANVNEPIPLPVEDVDVEDDVIVVPSDDDEAHAEEYISTSVNTQVQSYNSKTRSDMGRLVRKEIKSLLDIIEAAKHRIESSTNVVEGLMKLILQNMKDTTKWMEQLEPYFTK
uniref:Uncharacterized protein n=1 Tax=Tanacetum cinerariifolium TaxID=118510 RepID=A0A699I5H0_TANCI|nr:hypothetical protein [Tanacetum cinerariifolium]